MSGILSALPGSFAPAASGFSYNSVIFDGTNDKLLRGGDPVPDGKLGLLSFWMRMGSGSSDSTNYYLVGNTGNSFYVRRLASSGVQVVCTQVNMLSVATVNIASNWVHVLASWDTAVTTSAYIYLNGTNSSPAALNVNSAIDYASGDFCIGDLVAANNKFNGLMSEFYFTDQYLDITNSANRDKFRNSSTGHPVDLGADGSTPTGTAPRIYLRNGFATWQNNLGSGGNFSVTGALGDGGADIP